MATSCRDASLVGLKAFNIAIHIVIYLQILIIKRKEMWDYKRLQVREGVNLQRWLAWKVLLYIL